MNKKRKWSDQELKHAVKSSYSIRQVLKKLGLVEAGGNYQHVRRIIKELNVNTSHFKGQAWAKGQNFGYKPKIPLNDILVKNSHYQSYELKLRLFAAGLKTPKCEICGWSKSASNGRIPVELDHINGDHLDNRIHNLRILCPNCHSLQPTHRGINKVKYKRNLAEVV